MWNIWEELAMGKQQNIYIYIYTHTYIYICLKEKTMYRRGKINIVYHLTQ